MTREAATPLVFLAVVSERTGTVARWWDGGPEYRFCRRDDAVRARLAPNLGRLVLLSAGLLLVVGRST